MAQRRPRRSRLSPGSARRIFRRETKYVYSNSGYVLLATVVERVSGQSMKQFAAQNIFAPVGMTHTSIVDRYPANIAALARGYAPAKQGFDIDESAWEQVGDGQVHTTVGDLLLWTDNFRSGRVGGAALVKRMTEVGVLKSGERLDYAAGLVVSAVQRPAHGRSQRRLGRVSTRTC